MFGRRSSSSEVTELWSELHDLEKRVSDDIGVRVRSLEDERLRKAAQAEAAEETKQKMTQATLARRHKVFIAVSGTLGIGSTVVNILNHLKLI